jgi:hypothetical protein
MRMRSSALYRGRLYLMRMGNFSFVSGPDFSRAVEAKKIFGLSPWGTFFIT